MYNFEPTITKEFILRRINQEQIFQYYLNHDSIILRKKIYTNTLRMDSNPDCSYDVGSRGDLMFRDFAKGKSFTCFQIVIEKFNISYEEALKKIAIDFNLINNDTNTSYSECVNNNWNTSRLPSKKETIIQIKKVKWDEKNIQYWKKYYITEELLKTYNINPISHFWHNGNLFYVKPDSSYSYYFGKLNSIDRYKLLNTQSINFKWLNNCNKDIIQGYNQLPENGKLLIITKSLKDCLVLSFFGIPAIAPQSESTIISKEKIIELKERFTDQIIIFDNDPAGIENATKQSDLYDIPSLYIPKERGKDISDVIKSEGVESTYQLIKQLF